MIYLLILREQNADILEIHKCHSIGLVKVITVWKAFNLAGIRGWKAGSERNATNLNSAQCGCHSSVASASYLAGPARNVQKNGEGSLNSSISSAIRQWDDQSGLEPNKE